MSVWWEFLKCLMWPRLQLSCMSDCRAKRRQMRPPQDLSTCAAELQGLTDLINRWQKPRGKSGMRKRRPILRLVVGTSQYYKFRNAEVNLSGHETAKNQERKGKVCRHNTLEACREFVVCWQSVLDHLLPNCLWRFSVIQILAVGEGWVIMDWNFSFVTWGHFAFQWEGLLTSQLNFFDSEEVSRSRHLQLGTWVC